MLPAILNRNFRFPSPIPTRLLDQTASFGKSLARTWPTVFPAILIGFNLASRGHAPPEMPVFPIDFAYTSPSPPLHPNLLRPAGLSRWRRQRHNPPQHSAKQSSASDDSPPAAASSSGVFNQTAPGFAMAKGTRPEGVSITTFDISASPGISAS